MEEKNSDSRWSETAREFLSESSVPQANPTQPVTPGLNVVCSSVSALSALYCYKLVIEPPPQRAGGRFGRGGVRTTK